MRKFSWWGSASWFAAAWLADGCVLINYDQQVSSLEDGGGIEPVDADSGLDAQAALDALADSRADAASDASDAAGDAYRVTDEDAGADDGSVADAGSDGSSEDGSSACTTRNECGGCATLVKVVGDACGACGVGRYACAGSEALYCANDGNPASPGNPALIDDLEDGDENVLSQYGLSGEWYMVSDGTGGTLTPAKGTVPVPTHVGATGSGRSMYFKASGFTDWGAGMAVSLNAFGCGYDASKQTGVEMHMKGSGSVLVSVATTQTIPVSDGGTCTDGCNDLFMMTITAPTNWALRKAPFANLRQAGWGTPATFDPTQVRYVQFTSQPSGTLELYVDNLSFY